MYLSAPNNRYYDPRIEARDGSARISFEVKEKFCHAASAIHGSVYFKALDDAAFFAVNSVVEEAFVLTVSFTTYFTRPVSEGFLRAEGKLLHRSNNLFVGESVLYDSEDREVARGSGTFMKSRVPLDEKVGYR